MLPTKRLIEIPSGKTVLREEPIVMPPATPHNAFISIPLSYEIRFMEFQSCAAYEIA